MRSSIETIEYKWPTNEENAAAVRFWLGQSYPLDPQSREPAALTGKILARLQPYTNTLQRNGFSEGIPYVTQDVAQATLPSFIIGGSQRDGIIAVYQSVRLFLQKNQRAWGIAAPVTWTILHYTSSWPYRTGKPNHPWDKSIKNRSFRFQLKQDPLAITLIQESTDHDYWQSLGQIPAQSATYLLYDFLSGENYWHRSPNITFSKPA